MTDESLPPQPISRRHLLSLAAVGATGVALTACGGTAAGPGATDQPARRPDCVLTPEQIEGPFYTDVNLARRDITDSRPGSPLELRLVVVDAADCTPIRDAVVDVWHADAGGLYSAFTGQGDSQDIDTTAERFLRGIQTTNTKGVAMFTTIYPGWYQGRTTHIHLKVHLADRTRVTTQLFVPDEVSDEIYTKHQAYTERGAKDTSNTEDGFGGAASGLLMSVQADRDGHIATHTIGISRE